MALLEALGVEAVADGLGADDRDGCEPAVLDGQDAGGRSGFDDEWDSDRSYS